MDGRSFRELKSPIRRLGSTRKLLAFNNIRYQLNEQIRCLDTRMDIQMAIINEFQDFFKRKAEVELEYSKSLDKLIRNLQLRHKEQKQKRENWSIFSTYTCWKELLKETENSSKDHLTTSEIYTTHLTLCLSQIMEDSQRIYKRCRQIGCEAHEEILRTLQELYTTMKTYQNYHSEYKQAEAKLSSALVQKSKIEQSIAEEKLEKSKKYRLILKEVQKRKNKFTDAKIKALKAQNEYHLYLEASNMNIKKFFLEDIPDLINYIDFGFHDCIRRALMMHVTSMYGKHNSEKASIDSLLNCMNSMNLYCDKRKFLEANLSAFMIPKKIEFQGHKIENITEPDIKLSLHQDMDMRLNQLQSRIASLQVEIEEIWKTLQTAEMTIFNMFNENDYNCSEYFGENAVSLTLKQPDCLSMKLRANKEETEDFYLNKYQEFLINTTRISRLEAKEDYVRQSLVKLGVDETVTFCKTMEKVPRRRKIGRSQTNGGSNGGQSKLFGGSLEDYLESTKQEIPLILKSCIRVINLYGLQHQGIFRVSGSQVEINNFRDGFERGDDPLADVSDASDINSVAGVLKLYLRELREPLFPIVYFDQFMELAQIDSKVDFIDKMKDLVNSLPKCVTIVMRYLFAFLNHLSEFSDENMMDTYNLAICFGPTLLPVPDEKDQVQYQNLVNELIKNVIIFHEDIFSNDGGVVYEKFISRNDADNDVIDCFLDNTHEDLESEICHSEDDLEVFEAHVLFNFNARSDKEISLQKGKTVYLYSQISNDWWRGSFNGKEGLIPDKYISVKIKDEEKEKIETSNQVIDNDISFKNEENVNHCSTSQNYEIDKISENNLNSIDSVEMTENLTFSDKLEKWKEFLNNDNNKKRGSLHTPDLVVDLPLNFENINNTLSTFTSTDQVQSPTSSDSDSDNSENFSPADCFAKQKQSTLKKNSRKCAQGDDVYLEPSSSGEQIENVNENNENVNSWILHENAIDLKTSNQLPNIDNVEISMRINANVAQIKVKPALLKKPKISIIRKSSLNFHT